MAAKKQTTDAPSSTATPEVHCVCRVLKNGTFAGCVAAANTEINLTETNAVFHEGRGEVEILGTLPQ